MIDQALGSCPAQQEPHLRQEPQGMLRKARCTVQWLLRAVRQLAWVC